MAGQASASPDEFTSVITTLLQHPPDPNEPSPVWNRKGTIYGITIPLQVCPLLNKIDSSPSSQLQVLCWLFVATRLHTRIRVVRDPGLDDVFVVLAALFNLVSLIGFLESMLFPATHLQSKLFLTIILKA